MLLLAVFLLQGTAGFSQEKIDVSYIRKELKSLKVAHPDIVLRQIILESGYLTSNLTRTANNPLGMKLAKSRTTTAIGVTKSGFAIYPSIRSALVDYRIYQLYYTRGMTRAQYLEYIKRNYAKDSNYIEKLFDIKF